ncbi:MAG: M20/M25/M40 family metallo-hydrolase [Armatimonadetes bacterium]|nr:M20/M25/M40 family metallo-hydrolase [Armatimonadota bacterium]
MINEPRLVNLFRDLCLINAPSLQEKDAVAYVHQLLKSEGFEVMEDEAGKAIGGNANNLIAWLRGNLPDAPRIFLSAHFDTVEPTAGLIFEEKDGVFYSASDTILGADDKSGMAPAIEAVRAIKESGEPHGDVCLLFSCAEEIGLLGAAALKIEDLGLDFGYVLDTGPPVGSFVNRTATHDKIDIEIKGRPAHAGKEPEKGINAIQVAADAISGMTLGRIGPMTTANIGIISGGSGTNVVCPSVKLKAEARGVDEAELDKQVDHMLKRFESAAAKWGAEVIIDHRREYRGYEHSEGQPALDLALRASKAIGLEPELRTTLGGSDANVYNGKGIPSVVVGTGQDKIHTHDEFLRREDLINTTRLAIQLIKEAAKLSRASL